MRTRKRRWRSYTGKNRLRYIRIPEITLYLWAGGWTWRPEKVGCLHCYNAYWGPFGVEVLTPWREEWDDDDED